MPLPPPPQQPRHQPRRPGPSRLRRRARRAEARATAAAANATATSSPAKKVDASENDASDRAIVTAEAAVQTLENYSFSTDASVQVGSSVDLQVLQGHHQHVAAQVLPLRPRHYNERDVNDMLCPDSEYLTSIPQLDGSSILPEQQWSCKCCQYEEFFPSEDQLQQHHESHMIGYGDCNICYTGHVWTSR